MCEIKVKKNKNFLEELTLTYITFQISLIPHMFINVRFLFEKLLIRRQRDEYFIVLKIWYRSMFDCFIIYQQSNNIYKILIILNQMLLFILLC